MRDQQTTSIFDAPRASSLLAPEPTGAEAQAKTVASPPPAALPRGADEEEAFDEEYYLATNQDVARAVKAGHLPSGRAHYFSHGRHEGRLGVPPEPQANDPAGAPPGQASGPVDPTLPGSSAHHRGEHYLFPTDLSVTSTPPRRVALIGSCLLQDAGLHRNNPSDCLADMFVVNNASALPDPPAGVSLADYDFQIIQVPMRSLIPGAGFAFARLAYDDVEGHERAFEAMCAALEFQLDTFMEWNRRAGLLTFVVNFLVPQRNLMGCLFPRFDLRDPEHAVTRLNEHLERIVRTYRNAYVLDMDRISASFGRRFFQDDSIGFTAHGSYMGRPDTNVSRIEPLAPLSAYMDLKPLELYNATMWNEAVGMFRVVRQLDAVKLVIFDLDDTLWNGVSGDLAQVGPGMVEGVPLGIAEALLYLKKRGVMLAIVSKNDEARVRSIWDQIYHPVLKLDDFAAVRINWQPKAENIAELLADVNVLPRSVVFVDDNPAERAAVSSAFADMRTIGRNPYYLRRILAWSAETQVVSVTTESAARTEMMQRQIEREGARKALSREDFLRAAAPRVTMLAIAGEDDPRFARAFELVNKTNQFNTTGRRWKQEEFGRFFAEGGRMIAFEVADAYTSYGLVGVVLVARARIVQWVMSCRVLGFEVETAVMASITDDMRREGAGTVSGDLIETEVNFPCRTLFAKCGFVQDGQTWTLEAGVPVLHPEHITMMEPVHASP